MTDITLLDGGMGQELVHRAGDKPTPLWSTQIMLDHPGICLLYTSPSPRDATLSRMPSSA